MPKFLEQKLEKEYGDDKHAIYGTLNKIGAMHGNKETKKGEEMEKKHIRDKYDKKFSENPVAKRYKENLAKKIK